MQPDLFLPDIEAGAAGIGQNERQILFQQRDFGFAGRPPAQQYQGTQARSVILGPRPIGNIQGAIGIDPRFGRNRIAIRPIDILA